jgi:hypothetical protein
MRRAQTDLRRSRARSAFRQSHLCLTLLLLFLAAGTPKMPAAAQESPAAPAAPAGGPQAAPSLPGSDILPPPPSGGFGFANPLTPPNAVNAAIPPAAPAAAPVNPIGLAPLGYGVTPLQANDPNAPAYLVRPYVSVAETLSDNLRYLHSPRVAGVYTNLSPGLSFSADTPRLQAVLTGNLNAYFYAPTSDLNQVFGSLYGSGFGTIVPDALFVDLRSSITQASTSPGFGFQNASQLPKNQQTQVYANSVSPYFRKSFDGLLDSEVRYTLGSTNFGGNTSTFATTPASTAQSNLSQSNLSSGVLNEGTVILASGRDFQRALSRLTLDASNFNSSSTSRNSQVGAYDDLEYRITPQAAALARAGYQNIHYPFAPAATFVGPTWLIGGRVGSYGPEQGFLSLEYGQQQGVYGFSGSARYNITPTMILTASLVQGISSPAQYIQSALGTSSLDPYGAIVDEYSGLPTAFYSPGLGLTNNVYKQHLLSVGVSETIGANRYAVYGIFASQQALTPPTTTTPTKSYGVNFSWYRDIRPDLTGYASVGYYNSTNVLTSTTNVSTPTPGTSTNTLTANLGVNYLIAENLTGSILYGFSYQPNGTGVSGIIGRGNDIVVNQLTFQLSKMF